MSMTDPIADMLTRIRNAARTRKGVVEVPYSRLKRAIADILQKEGFLATVAAQESFPPALSLELRYAAPGRSVIQEIRRVSKPGQRKYVNAQSLPKVCSGYGMAVISTSQGLMTDSQARKLGIGGEVLCEVW